MAAYNCSQGNTVQHSVLQRNILQHATTNCNTRSHTVIHSNTQQHTISQCNALQHTAPTCTTLHHTAPHCTTLHHTAPRCTTVQHSAPLLMTCGDVGNCSSMRRVHETGGTMSIGMASSMLYGSSPQGLQPGDATPRSSFSVFSRVSQPEAMTPRSVNSHYTQLDSYRGTHAGDTGLETPQSVASARASTHVSPMRNQSVPLDTVLGLDTHRKGVANVARQRLRELQVGY